MGTVNSTANREWILRGESTEIEFSAMLEFHAEKSSRLPDEPIEEGSFATYNRVVEPREITCTLGIEGETSTLQNTIDSLTELCENDENLDLIAPESVYNDLMLESFSYRRDAQSGRGVLYVELRLKEVREVASFQTTTAVEEPIEPDDAADGSCADDVDLGEVQASASSSSEDSASGGKKSSILHDIFF